MNNTQNLSGSALVSQGRRLRRCGHCRQVGHDRRNCPTLRAEQQANLMDPLSLVQGDTQQPQTQSQPQGQTQMQDQTQVNLSTQIDSDLAYAIELDKQSINKYLNFINKTEYDIYIYWICDKGKDYTNDKEYDIKNIKYIEHNKELELLGKYGDQYLVSKTYFGKRNTYSNIQIEDILKVEKINKEKENIIISDKRSEIMKWKEASLKSKKILDDITKYGKGCSDTIDSLLDCIQDIPFPPITESDKEHCGVPSALTNITTITGIDPP